MNTAIFFSHKYKELGIWIPQREKRVKFSNHLYSTTDKEIAQILRAKTFEKNPPDFVEISKKYINTTDKKLKIVLQRMGGLGDILFLTPICQHLKSLGHSVSLYIHYYYHTALNHNPYIDKIYVNKNEAEMCKAPKGFKNLMKLPGFFEGDNNIEYFTLEKCQEFDKLIQFAGVIEHNPEAEKDHAIDVCYKWIDIDPTDKPKDIIVKVLPREKQWARNELMRKGHNLKKKFIGIAPTASRKIRSWPTDYYRTLQKKLRQDYNVIYFHHDSGWSLRETIALVSIMDCFVAVDSGLLHIAGALEKKLIPLFGPFNPDYRCRYFKNCHVLCGNTCENFCFSHADYCNKLKQKEINPPCLKNIKPEQVERKIREIC